MTEAPLASLPPLQGTRRRRLLAWLSGIAAALLVLFLLATSGTPSVPPAGVLTPRSVAAGRDAVRQLKQEGQQPDTAELRLDNTALKGLSALASDAFGIDRLNAEVANGTFSASLSLPLIAGRWLNASLRVEGAHQGFPVVGAKLGSVPVPGWATRSTVEIGRWMLRLRGTHVPPLNEMVQSVVVEQGELRAALRLPKRSGFVREMVRAGGGKLDIETTGKIYCRLVREQRSEPATELATHVRRAFAGSEPASAGGNRAAFAALAILTVGARIEGILPGTAEVRRACGSVDEPVMLAGRPDLAKHWALSGALAALLGPDAAATAGVWKELMDSLPNGSGFSFQDLAADRSGAHAGRTATAPATAAKARAALARATDAQLFPVTLLAAREGLSEQQLLERYKGLDGQLYRRTLRWIDGELARADTLGVRR